MDDDVGPAPDPMQPDEPDRGQPDWLDDSPLADPTLDDGPIGGGPAESPGPPDAPGYGLDEPDRDLDAAAELASEGPLPAEPEVQPPPPVILDDPLGDLVDDSADEPAGARAQDPQANGPGGLTDATSDTTDIPEIALPLDDDVDVAPLDLPEDNGLLGPGLVAFALGSIGAAAAAAVPAIRRLRQPTAPETVALLDSLGIDALVEHGDLRTIEEELAGGGSVLVATDGSAGVDADRVLHLRGIDRDGDVVRAVDHRGRRVTVPLDRFEAAWADSANQLVVATGEKGSVMLLPVVLDGLTPTDER